MLTSIACFIVLGPGNAAIKSELDKDYATFTKAFIAKDITKIGSLLTDNFTVETPQGKMTKKDVLAGYKSMAAEASEVKWPRTITRLDVNEGKATATVEGHFSGKLGGRQSKKQAFELIATTIDLWVKTPKGYRLSHSKVVHHKMIVDGKELPGSI